MEKSLKRISLMVREDQYEGLNARGLNVSGLIRDMIDDYLSDHKIILNVSEDVRQLYDEIVSNTGATDNDIEPYFKNSLQDLLKNRIKKMQELQKKRFGN